MLPIRLGRSSAASCTTLTPRASRTLPKLQRTIGLITINAGDRTEGVGGGARPMFGDRDMGTILRRFEADGNSFPPAATNTQSVRGALSGNIGTVSYHATSSGWRKIEEIGSNRAMATVTNFN